MRYSRRCTSNGFRAAGPRCGGFSSVMISPIKKSLCAAERHRKDVARARRRWIQQQGFLDTTRLVCIGLSSGGAGWLGWGDDTPSRGGRGAGGGRRAGGGAPYAPQRTTL